MLRRFGLFFMAFLLFSCATYVSTSSPKLEKSKRYVLLPFVNYTETPKAGQRAQAITYGVMLTRGYKVTKLEKGESDEVTSEEELGKLLNKARTLGDVIVVGYVNEWRYKTGIDGEPAVSVTVKFINAKSKEVIHSAVLSRSGWSYESVGVVAQKLISKAIP